MKIITNKFFLILFSAVAIIVSSCNNSSESSKSSVEKSSKVQQVPQEQSYGDKKVSIESEERNNPLQFLSTNGTYHDQFIGSKVVLEGTITNSATLANFKDVVLEVKYYTKTKTFISSENIIIYEYFPARNSKSFKIKRDAPNRTASVGWSIVGATPN